MPILAFDVCFGACSAAVLRAPPTDIRPGWAADIIAARHEPMATGHAERLLPMLDEVMTEAGLAFTALDAIAVTRGPGTFTGIRTGIAAARALALAAGCPLLAITSLDLVARSARRRLGGRHATLPLIACMVAGKGQIFAQLFAADGSGLTDPLLASPEQASMQLMAVPALAVGTAAYELQKAAATFGRAIEADLLDVEPSARDMVGAALVPFSPAVPLYLRPPDAIAQPGQALPRAT